MLRNIHATVRNRGSTVNSQFTAVGEVKTLLIGSPVKEGGIPSRAPYWGISVIGNAVALQASVRSSNLLSSTKADLAHLVEQTPCKRQVISSNPIVGTINLRIH